MIYNENKVVVIDRKKKDWPGITFPGGKVEKGESFTDSVIREVKEETGLDIYSPQICGIKDWFDNDCRYIVFFYKTNKFEGELKTSKEGEVWWEDLDNFLKLDLSKDMEPMLKVFLDDNLSEFFYRLEAKKWVYELK